MNEKRLTLFSSKRDLYFISSIFVSNITFTQTMSNTPEEEDLNLNRKKSSSRVSV